MRMEIIVNREPGTSDRFRLKWLYGGVAITPGAHNERANLTRFGVFATIAKIVKAGLKGEGL